MLCPSSHARRSVGPWLAALAVLAACGDRDTPSEPTVGTTESPATADAVLDTRSDRPGIVFGSFDMRNEYLNSVHTGWANGGPLDPSSILSWLSGARQRGGRVVVKLCKGRDSYVKNADGTFSLSKWKSLVGRYRNVNIAPYLKDGTIIGHYLIDEPHRAERWGGRPISQRTLEEMARYSKQLWPEMATLVRVVPSWLGEASISYRYLDAGWAQYTVRKGDAAQWVAAEAAAAKRKGLGLLVGMNVIHGGEGRRSLSASQVRTFGLAMLNESHACAFFMWQHNASYYSRSDVRSAMADLSSRARNHVKTSCRQ
jgi:hypothetical protein